MSSLEICRLGQKLVSPGPSPLLYFLAPSITLIFFKSQHSCSHFHTRTRQEQSRISPFSTSTCSHARRRPSSPVDLDFLDQPTPPRSGKFETGESTNARTKIDELLDSLIPSPNSATEVRKAYQATKREDGEIARRMNFPDSTLMTNKGRETLDEIRKVIPIAPRNRRTVRSRPTVGRTVELDPTRGIDFGRGLRQLGMLCAQNNVRGDLMSQRFHERPGMKRKRLKQQRWRKLFRAGFAATVGRVNEMRRKGW